jgi:hypothetical protein
VRGEVTPPDSQNVGASAFYHAADSTLTVVLLNHATTSQAVTLRLVDFTGGPFRQYRTSAADDFQQLADVAVSAGALSLTLPGESIVTLVGTGTSATIGVARRVPQHGIHRALPSNHVYDLRGRLRSGSGRGTGVAGAVVVRVRKNHGTGSRLAVMSVR